MNQRKHWRELASYASAQGARDVRVEHGGKHMRLVGKCNGVVIKVYFSTSPSDIYAIVNAQRDIRRAVQNTRRAAGTTG